MKLGGGHGRTPAQRGRVIALFGAPGAGTSTVARVLMHASTKSTMIVNSPLEIERARAAGAEVVLVDSVIDADAIRYLVSEGFVDGVCQGVIVHVHNPDTPGSDDLHWRRRREEIEGAIQLYNLPYRTIINPRDDLEVAVSDLM